MGRKLRSLICGLAVAALAFGLAACDTSPSSGSGGGAAATSLTIDMGFAGTTIQRNFNPFSPNATQGTLGYMYESLWGYDLIDNDKLVPWLATGYTWADGGRQLTIRLDPRATWSDGTKLTSADVVYTFQALTKAGQASFTYQKVAAPDARTVVLTFAQPGYTQLYAIGAQTFIVPAHVWSHENLKTWTNPDPVASGPYTLKTFSSQQLTLTARPDYWKQKVPVKTLYMPIISQSTGVLPQLNSGQVQWSGGAVPNVMQDYVAKDSSVNHAWYPSYGALLLYLNLTKAPFSNVNVRRGISLAIDRAELSKVVDDGLSYPVNLSGMDQKTQAGWLSSAVAGDVQAGAQDSQALAAFKRAGYTLKGGKLVSTAGKQLTMTITEVSTFANSVQRDQIICQQLAKVGVGCTVQAVPGTTQQVDSTKGTFDAVTGGLVYGVTPYDFYSEFLNSDYIGNDSYKNFERYASPATDALLKSMTETGDQSVLKRDSAKLEQLEVSDLPVIMLSDIGASAEYSTANWTGWPSASDPYAIPAPWAGPPDEENVLLHLSPAKK